LLFGRREKRRVKRKSKRGGLLKNLQKPADIKWKSTKTGLTENFYRLYSDLIPCQSEDII
jgi:hypothetical protein